MVNGQRGINPATRARIEALRTLGYSESEVLLLNGVGSVMGVSEWAEGTVVSDDTGTVVSDGTGAVVSGWMGPEDRASGEVSGEVGAGDGGRGSVGGAAAHGVDEIEARSGSSLGGNAFDGLQSNPSSKSPANHAEHTSTFTTESSLHPSNLTRTTPDSHPTIPHPPRKPTPPLFTATKTASNKATRQASDRMTKQAPKPSTKQTTQLRPGMLSSTASTLPTPVPITPAPTEGGVVSLYEHGWSVDGSVYSRGVDGMSGVDRESLGIDASTRTPLHRGGLVRSGSDGSGGGSSDVDVDDEDEDEDEYVDDVPMPAPLRTVGRKAGDSAAAASSVAGDGGAGAGDATPPPESGNREGARRNGAARRYVYGDMP